MVKIAATSLVKKTVMAAVMVASLAAAAGTAEARPFHRHHHGWGAPVAAGLALGLFGAAIASRAYADDGVVCAREARFDAWGNYLGRARVCRPAY
jgi:hypothetical protein